MGAIRPAGGRRDSKERPAIIISNDASNSRLNRLQVVPVTSNVTRIYPAEAAVTVAGRRAKALAHQLSTVSKLRVTNQVGTLSSEELSRVELAIRIQLGLLN